ncbi:TA system VapC family ribonuclease toxin [Mumia sp. DW29H23]|uniref:TA system VapC family ribonuclease toxin n=1 Tax=Mumia sp. DW29H23 TaxID=3421241 RepID=UPI003D6877EB
MRALLDINVLLALLDRDHADHDRARAWLTDEIRQGWASCPLTQNGFVRVISQPRYPSPVPVAQAIELLSHACATEHHELWPNALSLLDDDHFAHTRIHGPRQVTDVYLLATAVAQGGRFVTFDRAIPLSAVPRATAENLVVL